MNVLFVAIDDLRWGPARLPKFMSAAGFKVAALCAATNPLAHTKYVEQQFRLPRTRSARPMAAALRRAMLAWQPQLVIPADEQVFSLLQHVLRGGAGEAWSPDMLAVIEASLGDASRRDAMLFKNDTQQLAQAVGVAVPAGGIVHSLREATAIAGRIGFPVALKSSYSWAGDGVRLCQTQAQLVVAYQQMAAPEPSRARHWARRVLGRDWYPEPQPLWVQQRIIGDPAMYTLVASAGRMLAGFASIKRTTASATGASSIAECGPHAGMADVAARMTAALGATGFLSFDFMIERASGNAFLLECNPRPNHVSHLGGQLGVDLCAALHQDLCAVAGGASRNVVPTGPRLSRTIALYPQEWLRAPDSDALHHGYHDVPWDDPDLVVRLAMDVITETAKSMPAREAGNPFNFPIFAKRSL